jgi:chromate transporter
MLVVVFVGYRAHGVLGALIACTAMFLPVSILTAVIARHWETLRERPWALACERALAPIGIGLMAAGVYTLGRSGVQDWATGALAILAAVVLYGRWLPPIALVLVAGLVGWLAGL